ncbi:MAG: chromate transporter [Erysipelotrichales bacterium]|nr:chromate transporter [Erysipelotrichales bacterium]
MNSYLDLFLTFARIGGLTFGGGYAMLPMLERELVENKKWIAEEDLTDYFAIGQCTPGVIAVNVATFVGIKQLGTLGGIVATLGVVFPSVVIITVIAAFLSNFAELEVVNHAFAGLRVCVCVLIFNAVSKLFKKSIVDRYTIGIFLCVLGLSVFTNLSPIVFVVCSGIAGVVIKVKGGIN